MFKISFWVQNHWIKIIKFWYFILWFCYSIRIIFTDLDPKARNLADSDPHHWLLHLLIEIFFSNKKYKNSLTLIICYTSKQHQSLYAKSVLSDNYYLLYTSCSNLQSFIYRHFTINQGHVCDIFLQANGFHYYNKISWNIHNL